MSTNLKQNKVALRPCAFCGGPATLSPMPSAQTWWQVRCKDYHCGGTTWAMDDEDKAVAAWNRRPDGEERP
ncbi:Lar family restriction alleviation protein [Noviherbaspirillum sp.]|uniref:Lar family restriction alleviation protein n=1 Tax=Noviherbaspirillum sp. TaxID=1926288 RepID=UPI0034376952